MSFSQDNILKQQQQLQEQNETKIVQVHGNC